MSKLLPSHDTNAHRTDPPERGEMRSGDVACLRRRHLPADSAILCGLAVATLLIGGRGISVGGLGWSDAPLHTMDGVFLHDLLIERPEGSLREWAEQYYLRYQCLGIAVYYPPLFAGVEAVVFLLMGVSVTAARLTVLLFVVGAVWFIYLLARDLFGRITGAAAAMLAITTPSGVEWSRTVMLEWPATFFIVLTLWAYRRYLCRPRWGSGVLLALGCTCAYLTKQTALFVLPLIVAHACWSRRGRMLLRRSLLVPLVAGLVVIAAYAIATRDMNKLAPQLILGSPPLAHLLQTHAWTWYVLRLPAIIGWPATIGLLLTGAIVLGGILRRVWSLATSSPAATPSTPASEGTSPGDGTASPALPAMWLLAWWIICSVFAAREERYFFFAVPAIAICVVACLARLDRGRRFGIGHVVIVLIVVVQLVTALRTPAFRLPTMRPAVEFLAACNDADLVLVDAVRDGQFIFDVRTTHDARGRIVPMRASKFLYSRAARTQYNFTAHIQDRRQLLDWLNEYGIRYVVIEDRLPKTDDLSWDTPQRILLRETLADKHLFEQVFSQSLAGDHPDWQDVRLIVYRYLNARARQSDTIRVRIPAMDREVSLRLPPGKVTAPPGSQTAPTSPPQ